MAEQTNKEKLDSLIGSVNLLFEKLNSINMDHRSKIEDLENNIFEKIEENNNIILFRIAIIEDGINKIYGSQEHIYTTLNNLIAKINENDASRILNNNSEISKENTIESLKQEIEAIKDTLDKLSNDIVTIQTKLSFINKEDKKSINDSIKNLDKIFAKPYNHPHPAIVFNETLDYMLECLQMETTNDEKDIIREMACCKIGGLRTVYIDGEPFKFVKLGEETITGSKNNSLSRKDMQSTILCHDFACIDYPKLFRFDDLNYEKSEIRKWINNEFIQMIEPEVVKHMVVQHVQTGNTIVDDFVKIPSCNELNVNTYPTMIFENNPYELFKVDINYRYTLNSNGYWTRTNCKDYYSYQVIDNRVYGHCTKDQLGIVPIIRIKE